MQLWDAPAEVNPGEDSPIRACLQMIGVPASEYCVGSAEASQALAHREDLCSCRSMMWTLRRLHECGFS